MREDSSDVMKELDMDLEFTNTAKGVVRKDGLDMMKKLDMELEFTNMAADYVVRKDSSDMMKRSDMEPEVPHTMGYITRDGNMETTKK